ncbi:ABC transporter ATP-binding protein [Catenulispora rubra]|uniref:ABC transporter ATP-binding protein n=1 Tax=Catenulispora rubra TaxID=280293 RepID=UPI00189218E9|nr:ABC transporter ATP-binding protein [Catenulispora rubra]
MTRLDVKEVTVRFGGVTAVDQATISADGGQVTALIGPNGAGKTTLFNVVTGLQRPTSGRVFLDGDDITHTPTHRRARHGIARTFQRLEAFGSLTVEENIRVAADAVRTKDAKPAQVTRGLIKRIGLERYANARADAVPTGVARLVELARALAIDPELLLLDEPSSGLSEEETDSFGELLRDLAAQGRAVLIVEHDMGLIMRVSDRIHVLDRGRLIASGTPAEVQADPLVRKAYLGEEDAPEPGEDAADDDGDPIKLALPDSTLLLPPLDPDDLDDPDDDPLSPPPLPKSPGPGTGGWF